MGLRKLQPEGKSRLREGALAFGTGALGGLIGGTASRPTGALLARGEKAIEFVENSSSARQLNSTLNPGSVTAFTSLARTFLGAGFSNFDFEGTFGGRASAQEFALYPSAPSNTGAQGAYRKRKP